MASSVENSLCEILSNVLKHSSVDTSNLKVCRKTKDLIHGDFVVPKGVLDIDLNSETAQCIHLETTVQKETAEDVLPVSRLSQDKYNSVIFYMDRDKAFRNIIQEAVSAGEKYGSQAETIGDRVIVNPVDLHACAATGEGLPEPPVSLTQLRAVILLKHLLQLLIANGYQAQIAKFPKTENIQDILDVFHVESSLLSRGDLEKTCEQMLIQAQKSSCRETLKHESGTEGNTEGSREGEKKSVALNLRQYVEINSLPLGRRGYDKNLNLVTVVLEDGSVSEVTREAAMVELMQVGAAECDPQVNPKKKDGVDSAVCVHLVSQSLAYAQQQADLVWRICTHAPTAESIIQHHLVFGSVGRRKSTTSVAMDAKEFYNVRYTQMTQAAMMKYGDHDQGAAWDDMIAGLTAASISFDVLSTASPSQIFGLGQVQLDLSEDDSEGSVDNRSGPFILYNCARLATLLSSFQQQVEQGMYPPLPDPCQINFHLLREEEEWSIALLYVYGFPRLVQDTLTNWHQAPDIAVHVHTHKVAHFLLNFSKVLSSYYSRYHILGGPEAHLLPLMFARLSLMKAAHHVLCNGLKLLGLQPFSQL